MKQEQTEPSDERARTYRNLLARLMLRDFEKEKLKKSEKKEGIEVSALEVFDVGKICP